MPASREEHRLLYKIAEAYYVDELTQQQIADRFGLSRPKVSRLLKKAREERIVNVTLMPPTGDVADMERALERAYALKEVVVVSISDTADSDAVARELGPAAAECILRCISGSEVLGLAWGRTIMGTVNALPSHTWPDLTIVQLSGGLGPVGALEHSTELARRAAQKLCAKLRLIPAPGIVSTQAAAAALRADRQIAETLALAARADIAVVGLGVPIPDSVLLRDGDIVTADDLATLQASKAVGDIALRYIDPEGAPLDLELNDRIIGLTLDQLRRVPRVVGVAGGEAKYRMIRAALRGGLLDVLVTDHITAQALLDEVSPDGEL